MKVWLSGTTYFTQEAIRKQLFPHQLLGLLAQWFPPGSLLRTLPPPKNISLDVLSLATGLLKGIHNPNGCTLQLIHPSLCSPCSSCNNFPEFVFPDLSEYTNASCLRSLQLTVLCPFSSVALHLWMVTPLGIKLPFYRGNTADILCIRYLHYES